MSTRNHSFFVFKWKYHQNDKIDKYRFSENVSPFKLMKIICVNCSVKKKQKNSNNKQIQKTISNETNQQKIKKSYNKTTYQIDAMMILIINKNHAKQNVFDVFTSKNIATAKTCCRFMSTFNKEKMISTKWNFLKSQTIKFVKQFKKYFSIWLKRFRQSSSLSLNDEAYVFSEITIVQFHKIVKNRQIRICQIIDYKSYDFEDFAVMNVNINSSTTKKSIFLKHVIKMKIYYRRKLISFRLRKIFNKTKIVFKLRRLKNQFNYYQRFRNKFDHYLMIIVIL